LVLLRNLLFLIIDPVGINHAMQSWVLAIAFGPIQKSSKTRLMASGSWYGILQAVISMARGKLQANLYIQPIY
jgi:hypothetical protein